MNAERTAWLISRALGDVKAAQRGGPDALAKRIIRRHWHRAVLRNLPGWRWPR